MASLFKSSKAKEEEKKKEEEDAKTAAPVEEKGSVQTMKRGDYMIHIYVEQAKNLDVAEGDVVDPIVEINCLNERKFT